MDIKWIGSPNFDINRKSVDRVVIHWFGVGKLVGTDTMFQKTNGTSSHFAIEDKIVHQYVDLGNVAYHAGSYAMNQRSVGIEHSAEPNRLATDETYKTSAEVVKIVCQRFNIPIDRSHIIKHSQVIPTQCPGTMDLDKIINLAKNVTMPETQISVDKESYEKLVRNSSIKEQVYKYLEIVNPDIASYEDFVRVVGGYKSRITDLQNQLDNSHREVENIKAQLANKELDRQTERELREELSKRLTKALEEIGGMQGVYDDKIRVLQGQLDTKDKELSDKVAEINVLNEKLENTLAGQTEALTIGDVLILLFKKISPIKLK